ncbi:thiamine phosphate synthase [Sphingomonas sp. RT2P30]|uniref:thiamine phosphate synthase n=1 Tax=Parasphingomonas halimpatiens TaxID=3096162 RepID=UPI002FC8BD10
MRRVDAIPTIWLMTDERLGESLWRALATLSRGAGIIFRHHATDTQTRRALFARVRAIARRRGLVLIRAGATRLAGEQGVHNARGQGLRSASVHSLREALAARRHGADLVFVSPLHATRSHPGAASLGVMRAAVIARHVALPAIALGGMDARRFRRLRGLGFHGWAGIDAWAVPNQRQKWNAVPT